MTVGLPEPAGDPSSLREEFAQLIAEIRNYRSPELPEDVQRIIHDVAMDSEVSAKVIAKISAELPACRRKYYRISARLLVTWLALIPLSSLAQVLLSGHVSSRVVTDVWGAIALLAVEAFILEYFDWRAEYRDSYMANFLIRTLEFGLRYQSTLTDERFRDGLATMIQRTAIRYSIVYKRSNSTRFFAAQVRRQAKSCRNDLMSLVPGLVVARQPEIRIINENLARLLIRTQTGYWYETSDIARHGMPMPRRNAIRISLAAFIKDRSIQVAFIALAATIIAAIIALLTHI
jgi:hypothetical protein